MPTLATRTVRTMTMQPPDTRHFPVTVSPPESAHTVLHSQCRSPLGILEAFMRPLPPRAAVR